MRQSSKGHRADIWRRPGAKHCSSLCSQSEGGEYCGGQALKIQQSHAPERWSCSLRVRGPHFASKVSYNAGAATDDYADQCPCKGRIFRVGGNEILKDCRSAHAASEGRERPLSRFVHSTTVALRRKISLRGRSEVSVLTLCMALTTSRPMVTSPNTVYCPSSQGVPPFLP